MLFFFFKQKTAYEIGVRLVGAEMCIRDRCGTDWQASRTVSAPTARARSTMAATGLIVPRTLDTWVNATILVRSVMTLSRSARSRRPSSVTPCLLYTSDAADE